MIQLTYSVQAAWTGNLTGVFVLDSSTLDGTDVLAGSFGNNAFDDLTAATKHVQGTRGRTTDLASMEMGTFTVTLDDPTGTYNPKNASSPLAGLLVPMRPVRIRATSGALSGDALCRGLAVADSTTGIAYGFTRRIWHNPHPNIKESYIEAVDFFTVLKRLKPTIASTGATTAGVAIGLILDAADWVDPTMRALDAGGPIADFSADGATDALTLIANLQQIDLGRFFIDGDGVATYHDRYRRWLDTAVTDTFTGTLLDGGLQISTDGERIVNRQTVTRSGGTAQTASDGTSTGTYGYSDGNPITSAYLTDDAAAENLAAFLVALQKDPLDPAQSVTLENITPDMTRQILEREIGDYVAHSEPSINLSDNATIERLQWSIAGGPIHHVAYTLIDRNLTGFTLDSSALDGSAVLVP